MFSDVSILPILVSAILAGAVGSIWYSPLLFGTHWMRSVGLKIEHGEVSEREMIKGTIRGVFVHIILFFIITQFISTDPENIAKLTQVGVLITSLVLVFLLNAIIWEKRPINYLFINLGYNAIVIFGGIAVIAFWPW